MKTNEKSINIQPFKIKSIHINSINNFNTDFQICSAPFRRPPDREKKAFSSLGCHRTHIRCVYRFKIANAIFPATLR